MAVRPKSTTSAFAFIVMIALALFAPRARPEQPPATAVRPAESNMSDAPRMKPQIIYRLPRESGYGATLHSQAKGPNNTLPVDGDSPVSLQMSRAAANQTNPPQPQPSAEQLERKPNIQPTPQSRPRLRSSPRSKGPGKAHGSGNSHGNKSQKK